MNVHHLELFYHVARHGGIMAAVRNIPYGIQQPAVSAQVARLEEFLGTPLFQRRPFALTPAGEKLYQFIQPFFGNLDRVADELQHGRARHIRIGAATLILRDHLPGLLRQVRRRFPGLKVSLREGYAAQLEDWLRQDEIDLAFTIIDRNAVTGLSQVPLLDLPLVLLVHQDSDVTSGGQLWARGRIDETLICLPAAEAVTRSFQGRLAKLGIEWWPGVEVSSMDLVESYVASGLGIGVGVAIPRTESRAGVRAVALPDFPPVRLGALWRGAPSPLIDAFLAGARTRVRELE